MSDTPAGNGEAITTYKSFTCEVCGMPGKAKLKGRPRFQHDDCRKLNQLLGWIEDLFSDIEVTEEAAKKLRSRLWYLANQMNGKVKEAQKNEQAQGQEGPVSGMQETV